MKKSVIILLVIFSFICLSFMAFNSYCSAEEPIKNFTEKYGKDIKIRYDKSGRPIRIGPYKDSGIQWET